MKHVLIVGDSQAAGPVGQKLRQMLQGRGFIVERMAETGHGAADWVRLHWDAYTRRLADFRPDDVILLFGSNDPPNQTLADAFARFRDVGPTVWYAGPPQYPTLPDRQERSAQIRLIARSVFGRRHLDAWPYTGASVSRPDGVHFSPAGADVWARGIVETWERRQTAPIVWGIVAVSVAAGVWWWLRR